MGHPDLSGRGAVGDADRRSGDQDRHLPGLRDRLRLHLRGRRDAAGTTTCSSRGQYSFSATAFDASGGLIATGCTEVTLPIIGRRATVDIEVADGDCGPPDAGSPDTDTGVEEDAGPGCVPGLCRICVDGVAQMPAVRRRLFGDDPEL